MNDRAALLEKMQEPFRKQAQQNVALYRELCGEAANDATEDGMKVLWLQNVTDGNESYKTYLISPLWKRISGDVLLRDQYLCKACHREAEVVHHCNYSYEVMAGLDDSRLISLCNPCHHYIHFHGLEKTASALWDKRLHTLQQSLAKKRMRQEVRKKWALS